MQRTVKWTLNVTLSLGVLLGFSPFAVAVNCEKKPSHPRCADEGTAVFQGDIISGTLTGSFVDHGDVQNDFETLEGELAGSETITVAGPAGQFLGEFADSVLPGGIAITLSPANCNDTAHTCGDTPIGPDCDSVTFNASSGASWNIRLDHDKVPADRVQFKMEWRNQNGEKHRLRVGWVVTGNPLEPDDYGDLSSSVDPALGDAAIQFLADPFRIDGDLLTGRGKKTSTCIYSHYYDASGITEEHGTASFDIDTVVP